jgi:uncharacterized protein YegP (UPF0339 family)
MVKFPKYQIKRSFNKQYYWVLHAVNGNAILTSSEQYVAKQDCIKSIASSTRNIVDSNFNRLGASSNQYYFLQRAGNYEDLGKSEMYESSQARENGITAVKRDAPNANVEDLTI